MKSLNEVTLLGNLGMEPEVKFTGLGTAQAVISIATNEEWKDKDGKKQQRTEWHRVILWEKLAEIAGQYLDKGQLVFIRGKLKTRQYEQDGKNHFITEIVGQELIMLSPGKKTAPVAHSNGREHARR